MSVLYKLPSLCIPLSQQQWTKPRADCDSQTALARSYAARASPFARNEYDTDALHSILYIVGITENRKTEKKEEKHGGWSVITYLGR